VHEYVVDPLNDWMAPPARDGASLHLGKPTGQSGAVAAALVQPAAPDGPSDPLESINRRVFAFNNVLRSHVLQPITQFYRGETPSAAQEDVQNFFSNLREPITIVSSLLEGKLDDVGNSGARFGINTTIGIVGIHDPATAYGFPRHTHNLEEALCVYRVPSGPYIVLPLYGPATVRDAVGRLATIAAYFEAMGYAVYIPYRVGDAVAQSTVSRESGAAPNQPSMSSYEIQKLSYFAGRDAGCGNLVRNGAEKLSP
jgi:phospholipid-binding lipoprotein MlaA